VLGAGPQQCCRLARLQIMGASRPRVALDMGTRVLLPCNKIMEASFLWRVRIMVTLALVLSDQAKLTRLRQSRLVFLAALLPVQGRSTCFRYLVALLVASDIHAASDVRTVATVASTAIVTSVCVGILFETTS